ncbi:hypothetical protein ABZ299_15155 [Streptomyces sp. NPDC006184]|uniref:hypothetical protein n=1 Tax=Streptomyces sp. NPDC006184 TaxID=3155455 RepID=UPI0033B0C665
MTDETPQLTGDFRVYPSVGRVTSVSVRVNVAIAPEESTDVQDTPVAVELGRAAGPLPTIRTTGADAFALYRYDNPGGPVSESLAVTVRGGAATFDVSLPVG